jgi:predicted phage-related endonuclease
VAVSLTPEQLVMRREGIGGSEASAIVGENPYMSLIDVYNAKKDPNYSVPVTHHMERGIFYEPGTANWYAHRTGAKLREVGTVFHPKKSFVFCTPDRLATKDDEYDLSIKVPGPYALESWGEPGTDEAPEHAILQVNWEGIVLGPLYGIRRAEIVAPIDGDLAVYPVRFDTELQEMMLEAAERFWKDYVVPGRPPPPDGSDRYTEWLKNKFPKERNREALLTADERAEQLIVRLKAAKEAAEQHETEAKKVRQELELIIGDSAGITGRAGYVYWRKNKDGVAIDYKAICDEVGVPEDIVKKHTRPRTGSRPFKPYWSKK